MEAQRRLSAPPAVQAIESYERVRAAAVARGDRSEPIAVGTSFTLVGRKLGEHER